MATAQELDARMEPGDWSHDISAHMYPAAHGKRRRAYEWSARDGNGALHHGLAKTLDAARAAAKRHATINAGVGS